MFARRVIRSDVNSETSATKAATKSAMYDGNIAFKAAPSM